MKTSYLLLFLFTLLNVPTFSQTDQVLIWGSYYGVANSDSQSELVQDIAELSNGNFVILGRTDSESGLSTEGAHQTTGMGDNECFLACFNEDRERLWSTYFGGVGSERPTGGVMGMSDGSIVVAGTTSSASNISTTEAFQENIEAGFDYGFLSRFSESGELLWSTYLGPPDSDSLTYSTISDIVVLSNDDIVIVGHTFSPNFPVTDGAFQSEKAGSFDAFMCRFNDSGELVWSTFYGGPASDQLYSVEIDSQGNIIASGHTESVTGISTQGVHQTDYAGEGDLFIVKFTDTGSLLWGTYLGGAGEEFYSSNNIVLDEADNIYITGMTSSETSIATAGAHQMEIMSDIPINRNILIGKFSPSGEHIWGTYFGTSGNSGWPISRSLAILGGSLVLAGHTPPDGSIISGDPWQSTTNSASNFIASFTLEGEWEWGTYYGGEGGDSPYSIKSFSNGTLAIAGHTNSNNEIATPDAFQPQNNGNDGFFSFFEINFFTAIDDMANLVLKISPNPTTSHIRLHLPPEFAFRSDIRIYNSVGQSVAQIENFNSLEKLPMNYPPGVYVIEASNGDLVAREKVMVE